MAHDSTSIELVPSRNSLYSTLDDDYSPRGSHEQAKDTNGNETSTNTATSYLLKSDSAPETPKTFASDGQSLSKFRWLPEGWRFGAALGAVLSLFALIANLVVAIALTVLIRQETGHASTVASILKGTCKDIKHVGVAVHLVINLVSTLLLGASSYCMQCLSAPTREDVGRAHRKGAWLDIGVPSLRNVRFIKPMKLFLWMLLGLSSVPLHLVDNSTFFVSLANNSYDIYYASDTFATGSSYEEDIFPATPGSTYETNPSKIQSRAKELGLSTMIYLGLQTSAGLSLLVTGLFSVAI